MCAKVKAEVIFMSDAVAEILQVQRKTKFFQEPDPSSLLKENKLN